MESSCEGHQASRRNHGVLVLMTSPSLPRSTVRLSKALVERAESVRRRDGFASNAELVAHLLRNYVERAEGKAV